MEALKISHRERIEKRLEERKAQGNYRELYHTGDRVDFCSNDYLGFARSSELANQPAQAYGSTGSRLITGNSEALEALENHIADYHEAASGLIFNSGYTANLGLLSCLPQRSDTILFDRQVHASIRDGIRLSAARSFGFGHNDMEDLENKLRQAKGAVYIIVESVYSMDGDLAPLEELVEISKKHKAVLIVDEAHAVGVFGEKGAGRVVELSLSEEVFARVLTFGKALGGQGAIILGPPYLRNLLINFCRPFIYTTALPPMSIQHLAAAYHVLAREEHLAALQENIQYFNDRLDDFPSLPIQKGDSTVKSLSIPGNEQARQLAAVVREEGYEIKAILHPTVPLGQERLRICLHAFNTKKEIDEILNILTSKISS